jgi:hypothetical protein
VSSSASDILKLELQAVGENASTWGTKANVLLERLEQAVAGRDIISLSSSTYTLDDTQYVKGSGTTAESHYWLIEVAGTAGSDSRQVVVPTRAGQRWLIFNNTGDSKSIVVKTASGTGPTIASGRKMLVYTDGTNVVEALSDILELSSDSSPQLGGFLDVAGNYIQLEKGTDIVSASPVVLTGASAGLDGDHFDLTGTTNFAAFTVAADRHWFIHHDGILTMTHHTTNLDLPGEANITTAAGDISEWVSTGTNTVRCTAYTRAATVPVQTGKHTIWVPASAMAATTSNGCANLATVETTSGRPDILSLDFDNASDEHAQFSVAFPKSWNLGTVNFQVFWASTATDTDGVAWGLQGVACADGNTMDVAYGTGVVVTDDAQSTNEDLYVTAESGAVTIAGSPAADELTFFRIYRDVSDGNDDMAEDAQLIGCKILYSISAENDS